MPLIGIQDSLHDPDQGSEALIPYRTAGEHTWYRVHVFLTGADVAFVRHVRYYLPKGFEPAHLNVEPTWLNQRVAAKLHTHLIGFEVVADVWFRYVRFPYRVSHMMSYHQEISQMPGQRFVRTGSLNSDRWG